jgi:HEAT repeat protein
MSEAPIGSDVASPLCELARAFRARRFYPRSHPAFREALARASIAVFEAAQAHGELALELRHGGFALRDGTRICGPGIDELAQEFARRRVRAVRLRAGIDSGELSSLVEALCGDVDAQERAGGIAGALREARLGHLELELRDGASPGGAGAPLDAPLELDIDGERSELGAELTAALAALDGCTDVVVYTQTALQVERAADLLLRRKGARLAYAAVSVLARHAEDPARAPRLRAEAQDRLTRLLCADEMLGHVVELACSPGVASVEAARVLMALGAAGIPRVLERVSNAEGEARRHAAALVLALGEQAFPLLVEELVSEDSARARRAARLLGDLQHPGGIEFLVRHLAFPDPMVKKEIARALARIPNERAIAALVAALDADAATAEIAAAALGHAHSDSALEALLRVAGAERERPVLVRREAIRSLGRLRRSEALPELERVLRRRTWFGRKWNRTLRVAAAQALGRLGGARAFALLEEHARRGDQAVREACSESLRAMVRSAGV